MNQKGIALFNLVVALCVIVLIIGAIAPIAYDWYREAKLIRAQSDVAMIAVAIIAFEKDLKDWPVWVDGHARTRGGAQYAVLYSHAGQHPACDGTYAKTTDWQLALGSGLADTLENQLVRGRPGDVVANAYPDETDDIYELHGSYYHWQGPYLGAGGMEVFGGTTLTDKDKYVLSPDPWGNKYYVNIQYLRPGDLASRNAVFVISAGPNEMLETECTKALRDFFPRGDDIVFRIK